MAWRNTTSRLLLIAVAIFVTATVSATTWSADNIPMVHLQDRNRYVCDPDNIISPADLDSADVYLRRLDIIDTTRPIMKKSTRFWAPKRT